VFLGILQILLTSPGLLYGLGTQQEEVKGKLQNAPEKGRLQTYVRREREEREHDLEGLNRRIGKKRSALKKMHEL
jgi:hypothetical protein